ncbi:MAG: type II toxin-antitoxin system VapC family toxin [Planctomycetota bacterium]|nr:type II toxin-antitoxin system VapC family toxin [Planctomycetota bacterium]
MTHLLDTNICSAYLKRPGGLAHRFMQHAGGLALPTIVLAELYTWAFRRPKSDPLLRLIEEDLIPDVRVLDFDAYCARQFGELRAAMLTSGVVVNPVDLMIATVALTHDLVLVTHNVKHFEVVPNLRIEDWLTP